MRTWTVDELKGQIGQASKRQWVAMCHEWDLSEAQTIGRIFLKHAGPEALLGHCNIEGKLLDLCLEYVSLYLNDPDGVRPTEQKPVLEQLLKIGREGRIGRGAMWDFVLGVAKKTRYPIRSYNYGRWVAGEIVLGQKLSVTDLIELAQASRLNRFEAGRLGKIVSHPSSDESVWKAVLEVKEEERVLFSEDVHLMALAQHGQSFAWARSSILQACEKPSGHAQNLGIRMCALGQVPLEQALGWVAEAINELLTNGWGAGYAVIDGLERMGSARAHIPSGLMAKLLADAPAEHRARLVGLLAHRRPRGR